MTNPSHECPGRNTHRFQPNNEQPPFITKSRVNSSQSNPFQGNVPVEHRLKGTKGESTPKPYYGKKSIIPENDAINIWKEHAILTKSRVNSNNLNPLAKQTYLSCARNQRRDNSYNPTMVKNPSYDDIWKEHTILTKARVNSKNQPLERTYDSNQNERNSKNPFAKQTYLSCARNQRRDNSYNPTMV